MKENEKITEAKTVLADMDEIYHFICQNDINQARALMAGKLPKAADIMTSFIESIDKLREHDIDIPADVLISQLNNLLDAYENNDYVMLADSLHYELTEAVKLYVEIMEELAKDNVSL